MNDKSDKVNNELMTKLAEALAPYPEAVEFALAYRDYIHQIDDLIDSQSRPTPEEILRLTSNAALIFSHPFWIKHSSSLLFVEQLINNTYADSVIWEHDAQANKRRAADTLRHAGLDMFFAIILITLGRESLRKFSPLFREQCHDIQGWFKDTNPS